MAEAMASVALVSIGHEWLYSGVGGFSRPPLPPTPQPLLLCQKKATDLIMSSVEWLKPWPPWRWFQLGTNGCVPEWAASAVLLFFRRFNPSPPRQKKATAEAVASVGPRERERDSNRALVKGGVSGVGDFSRPPLPPTHEPLLQR